MAEKKKLKITLKKSVIGRTIRQKRTIEALGIKRLHHTVIHTDTPQIRGMISKVSHLVVTEEVQEN
ncbi:50S ribosomal protein L30 [candidate division KSB1 bacterium]|nr:50S ribosomal protein L30 [candidate division KSB1 bacterium]